MVLGRHVYGDGKWKRVETIVEAKTTNHYSSLQITTTREGSYLLDQVSVMPLDTYMVSRITTPYKSTNVAIEFIETLWINNDRVTPLSSHK